MATGGYAHFDKVTLNLTGQTENFYLGGRWYTGRVPRGFGRAPSAGATVLETHAGTAKIHLPYLGLATATSQLRAYRFGFEWQAVDEADWFALKAASVSRFALDFCPLLWETDEIAPVSSGSAYTITRRVARSVIAEITSVTHPDKFTLDGTAGSHGSITAQAFTATASGSVLIIDYVPVYRVVVSKFDESISRFNDMKADVELVEAPSR